MFIHYEVSLCMWRKRVVTVLVLTLSVFIAAILLPAAGEKEKFSDVPLERFDRVSFSAEASGPKGNFRWNYSLERVGNGSFRKLDQDDTQYLQHSSRELPGSSKIRTYRFHPDGSRKLYEGDIKLIDFNSYVRRPFLVEGRRFGYEEVDSYQDREIYNTSFRQIEGFEYPGSKVSHDRVYVDVETGLILYSSWKIKTDNNTRSEKFYLDNLEISQE